MIPSFPKTMRAVPRIYDSRDAKLSARPLPIHTWSEAEHRMRRARIRNYYNSDLTGFFPFRLWPVWAQDILLSAERTRHNRYQLFYWLFRNGASPALRRHAVLVLNIPPLLMDMGIEELAHFSPQLETSRSEHVNELEKQVGQGYFDSHGGRWYDLTAERVLQPGPNGPEVVQNAFPWMN